MVPLPWIGTQRRPSGPIDNAYGWTPVFRLRRTLWLATSTTATPLPSSRSSYIETKTSLPSREVVTNRGVLRSLTAVTFRVTASITDRKCELWFATYTVVPSGETTTPSGSAPTRTVATTVGFAMLLMRLASGTLAGAGVASAFPLNVDGVGVGPMPCTATGGPGSRFMVNATATPA